MKTKTKNPSANAITSLPPSPDEERRGRMIRYSLAMLVRLVCIIVAFLVPGWWALVPAIGAIVLPYVAVVLANVGHEGPRAVVERPGGLEIYRPQATTSENQTRPGADHS
jgi:predicted tellurium resistance membrane protein TerC